MKTSYKMRRAPTTTSPRRETTERLGTGSMIWRVGLLVLFLLSVYVEVPLYLTSSLFVPSFFTLLVLFPILALMYYRRIYKYEAAFLGQVVLVLLLTALLSPGLAYLNEKLLGLFQTVISIAAGILLLKLLGDLPKRWVANVLAILCVLLVVGATLEVLGVLREASDAFRETAYSRGGYGVYDSNTRDEQITGNIRPKLFTSEPSLLAIGFFVFANSWLVLTYNKKRLAAAGLGTAVMLILTGSPVLLLSLVASLTIAWFKEPRFTSFVSICTLACLGGLGFALIQPEIASSVGGRVVESFKYAGTTIITSENLRVVFPYLTVADVLPKSPLFGTGISGKEVIERFSTLPLEPDTAMGNNALAMLLIYTGFVGALLFGRSVAVYWRKVGIGDTVLLIVLILLLSQTMGGFETPRFWGYVFLFTGAVKMAHETRSRRRKPALSGEPRRAADSGEDSGVSRDSINGNSGWQDYNGRSHTAQETVNDSS